MLPVWKRLGVVERESAPEPEHETVPSTADRPGGSMDPKLVLVMALACGLVVANNYYAQPLVGVISEELDASSSSVGLVVTASQVGYAIGLALLVPLGDLLERRRLLMMMLAATALALVGMAMAPSWPVLASAALLVGVGSVVGQILIPFAASLAGADEQGRVIGRVMTGLLLGILLARVVAGLVTDIAGWRSMFVLASGLTVATAVMLYRHLPVVAVEPALSYPRLLHSVVDLVREEPLLRRRMFYGVVTFAPFGVFWTSVGFVLAGPPYDWSDARIGVFTLFGVAGAVAANFAGALADRGFARIGTGAFVAITAISFAFLVPAASSAVAMAVGMALLDLGIQGTHISNQSLFYPLRPDARSRLNTAYMTAYFGAGALGSALSAVLYDAYGWTAVCVLGVAFPTIGFVVWVIEMWRSPGPLRGHDRGPASG